MSLTEKIIELTITLGTGNFGEEVGDTVTLRGYRMYVETVYPGGDSMGSAMLRVFGMPEVLMNQLTTIGSVNAAIRAKNTVSIAAGDDETGLQLVFFGVITDAWGDYNAAPEVAFNIQAFASMDVAVKPVKATSVKGSVGAAVLMKGFADSLKMTFEDNGVTTTLTNPYFNGTALNQIRQCAAAAQISYSMDRGTLAIWPRTGSRTGLEVPEISKESGMIGYPSFSSKGIDLQTAFNWNIKLGGTIKIKSAIAMANKRCKVYAFSHSLSTKVPGGPWFTMIECYAIE